MVHIAVEGYPNYHFEHVKSKKEAETLIVLKLLDGITNLEIENCQFWPRAPATLQHRPYTMYCRWCGARRI